MVHPDSGQSLPEELERVLVAYEVLSRHRQSYDALGPDGIWLDPIVCRTILRDAVRSSRGRSDGDLELMKERLQEVVDHQQSLITVPLGVGWRPRYHYFADEGSDLSVWNVGEWAELLIYALSQRGYRGPVHFGLTMGSLEVVERDGHVIMMCPSVFSPDRRVADRLARYSLDRLDQRGTFPSDPSDRRSGRDSRESIARPRGKERVLRKGSAIADPEEDQKASAKSSAKGSTKKFNKFRRGMDAVQNSASKTYSSTEYFKFENGVSTIIRFLTDDDEIITIGMHKYITGSNGKKNSYVCQTEVGHPSCELCEAGDSPTDVSFGIAVWRKELHDPEIDPEGGITGYGDEIVEEKDDKGVVKRKPFVGIVQQAPKNFWSKFTMPLKHFGTLIDRDYEIQRSGDDKNTDYHVWACEPVEIEPPEGEEDWRKVYENYTPDLGEYLERKGSKEYYARFLHGDQDAEESKNGSEPPPSDEDEAERLKTKKATAKAESERVKKSAAGKKYD
jgi:hypothetical protein